MTWEKDLPFQDHFKLTNLVQMLQQRAVEQADRLAFTFLIDGENKETNLTFGELDQKARAIAVMLREHIKPGDRVLLLYPPGLEFIIASFGCLYAGAIAVPVYPPEPSRLLETLPRLLGPAKDSKPTVAITTQKILSIAYLLFKLSPNLRNLQWLATDNVPKTRSDHWQEPLLTPDSLAFLMYTSGSTGNPKGVMLSHGNFLHQMKWVALQEKVQAHEKGVSWAPPYHISGLFIGILTPIYLGIHNILMSPLHFLQKPFRWLKAISHYKAFTSGAPNFAYDLCIDQTTSEEKTMLDLSCWRHALIGSEPIRPETLKKFVEAFEPYGFQKKSFLAVYGLTESTMIVSVGQLNTPPTIEIVTMDRFGENPSISKDSTDRTRVGCGEAIGDTQMIIVDPNSMTRCRADKIGEVWVSGSIVAQGYWNRPYETQKTFEAYLSDTKEGPFLRTGDLGYIHNQELFITGRLKEMMIIRGINYYPEDIEQTVEKSHPLLRPSCGAVFSIEKDDEERLIIIQEVEPLKKLKATEVIEKIREAVSKHHHLQVDAIFLIKPESIPRTVTKKIQRYACKEAFTEGALKIIDAWKRIAISNERKRTLSSLRPKTTKEIESWLVSKISEKLGIASSEINLEKPLVSYGLDSLNAVRITAEIEEELNVSIFIATLFESPSIHHLVKELKNQISNKQHRPIKLDLNREAQLDPSITFESFKSKTWENPASILLTGSTGFLGAFVLYELLQNTSAKIYCLARANDEVEAKNRIQRNLEFFSLWEDRFNERIIPVNGDLSKPLLGLLTSEFERLSQNIDVIYHVGAIVNFIFPYKDLKASNVTGTQEIIRLAGKFKLKPLHHISSVSVFPIEGHPEGNIFSEDDSPFYTQALLNGYAQSKWVAEKLIISARLKGLPATIYRVGEVIGHSVTGICRTTHDAYSNILKGGILLGSSPQIKLNLYLVPVDYVSKSIYFLSRKKDVLGKNFHIISQPREGSQILDLMAFLGYPLRRISYQEWLQEVNDLTRRLPQNPLAALMPFLTSPTIIRLSQTERLLKLSHRNTTEELKDSSIACPPPEKLMTTYFSYLKKSGFLNESLNEIDQ